MEKIKRIKLGSRVVIVFLLTIAAIALTLSFYYYFKYQDINDKNLTPKEQLTRVISKVGNLIELPGKETPELATVTDAKKLKDQPFFKNSQNGDKVLIYKNSQKIILYRPSSNKLIEVSSLNTGNQANTSGSNVGVTPTPKIYSVVLYNGTNIAGLTVKVAGKLTSSAKDFIVTDRKDASKKDYSQTAVVDLTNNNKSAAERLAGLLNGKVVSLPTGEEKPQGADFLVILAGE